MDCQGCMCSSDSHRDTTRAQDTVIVGMDLSKMVRHDELRHMPRCSSGGIGVLCLPAFLTSDSFRPEYAHICVFQLIPR